MELWDLYDEFRIPQGKTHVRGTPLPEDGYHLVVHVWIHNQAGQFLMSQRSATRPHDPLKWECVGGSVVAGEDSLAGALRETLEEVGISLDPDAGDIIYTNTRGLVDGVRYNDHLDVWLFEYNGEVDLAQATTDEVAQVKWMAVPEIKALYSAGEMPKGLGYLMHL
jgi:8-oxo-dGTP pyrophosphatase MutT (NUDIX family)